MKILLFLLVFNQGTVAVCPKLEDSESLMKADEQDSLESLWIQYAEKGRCGEIEAVWRIVKIIRTYQTKEGESSLVKVELQTPDQSQWIPAYILMESARDLPTL